MNSALSAVRTTAQGYSEAELTPEAQQLVDTVAAAQALGKRLREIADNAKEAEKSEPKKPEKAPQPQPLDIEKISKAVHHLKLRRQNIERARKALADAIAAENEQRRVIGLLTNGAASGVVINGEYLRVYGSRTGLPPIVEFQPVVVAS